MNTKLLNKDDFAKLSFWGFLFTYAFKKLHFLGGVQGVQRTLGQLKY